MNIVKPHYFLFVVFISIKASVDDNTEMSNSSKSCISLSAFFACLIFSFSF
jgi:hypothetical protein